MGFRKAIEQHLPQPTLIKFTREDIDDFMVSYGTRKLFLSFNAAIVTFLKTHNLLSSDE
jgi:hypothetical protein